MNTRPTTAPGAATQRLLRQVAARQRLAAIASRGHLLLLILGAAYAALLLVSRLLALVPNWFEPWTLLLPPAAALALALVLHRRPATADAARRVDTQAGTHDLFLTAVLAGQSPGEFRPIVLAQAEERATGIASRRVVPFRWEAKALHAAAAFAALLLGALYLPQLDPFGREKQRQDEAQRRRLLAESRKATELRIALLQKNHPEAKTSEVTRQTLEALKQAFDAMKPQDKQGNLRRLADIQKDLNELWRKRSEERLNSAFERAGDTQRLGAGQGQKAEEWKRRLQRGDPSALKKEVQDIAEKVSRLARASDPAERQKLQGQVAQQLKTLSDFLANNASSRSLQGAINRALEQLALAEQKGLSADAVKSLQESLQLTEMEMDALAQSIRDLQAIEKGLSAAQLAKMLNAMKGLDGNATQGLKDIEDYEEFYKKLMAEAGGCPIHGPG